MNKYYEIIKEAKTKIKKYLDTIYQVSGDELLLELEHYNLLTNKNNCIETSTATGYIMEEFITSKLNLFTSKHKEKYDEIVIEKLPDDVSTANSSYDCFANYKGIQILINIKVEKRATNNNAIAAINILHKDYVTINPNKEKAYIILKTCYSFANSKKDGERKIKIDETKCYALEEIDFSEGHKQDHRNWSREYNENSGRLQVPKTWIKNKKLKEKDISYKKTKRFIDDIYSGKNKTI